MSENIEYTGHRWQKELGEFLKKNKPNLIVETGVSEGVSTKFILAALDEIDHGTLVSIDPNPAYTTPHPRWILYRQTSHDALIKIFEQHGPFDVFIHDSDHDVECTTFEYELAWHLVKPRGYIFSDDITWAGHGAWDKFLERHTTRGFQMGYAGYTQKPADAPTAQNVQEANDMWRIALKLSWDAANARGEKLRYMVPR